MERVHLVIPSTGAYRQWAEITAASARAGCSLPIKVTILDWPEIERAGISRTSLESLGAWHGSAITYAKLYLTELFPELDRVIVCDADVLFRGDVAQLWKLGEATLGGNVWLMPSRDSQPPWREWNPQDAAWFASQGLTIKRPKDYFCAGFMMMDLKAMREGGWTQMRDAFLATYDMRTIPYGEQGVMNYLLQDHLQILPKAWGCFSGDTNDDVDYNGDCAIHYVGDTPWVRKGLTRLMSEAVVLWRQAAGLSTGGWRRWLWCALRATAPLWRWEPHLAWHFRTALKSGDCLKSAAGETHRGTGTVHGGTVNGMEVVRRMLEEKGVPKADEVWVHGMWLPRYWRACLGAKLRGKKLVRMTHGSLDPVRLNYSGWKKRLVSPIERLCFALTDRVVTTGPWETAWCRAWGVKGKIEEIDLKGFFELGGEDRRRCRCSADGALHVLYLGRRHPLKGVAYLERAVEEVSLRRDKSVASPVLRIVSDHFGAALEADWAWCDVLCLPTLSENFGLVVAEALARGKRVITTDGAPAWDSCNSLGGRLRYLRGYRSGDDATRVRLLKESLVEVSRRNGLIT